MTIYALGDFAPQIHADTWVAADANLIGQVVLQEGASVWFSATLRADHEVILVAKAAMCKKTR